LIDLQEKAFSRPTMVPKTHSRFKFLDNANRKLDADQGARQHRESQGSKTT
jgi:hypothetical protein